MIQQVFRDLFSFFIVFILTLTCFAIPITFINNTNNLGSMFGDGGCSSQTSSEFASILLYTYLLGVTSEENGEEGYGLFFSILLLFTLIVVMLNLLIAVVSETFEKVQENKTPSSYIGFCTLMLDIEQILWWRLNSG